MRAALIGDIHANLPALEAVLNDARSREADVIWNVGDFVGYGAFPEDVVRSLRQAEAVSVLGDYDRKVLRVKKKKDKWKNTKRPEKLLLFEWAYEHLTEESRKYLRSLPREVRLAAGRFQVQLIHIPPGPTAWLMNPEAPPPPSSALTENECPDLLAFGHTHRACARRDESTLLVNPGSIGRQDDGDPRARYAMLEFRDNSIHRGHHRVEYDVERAADAIQRARLPEALAEMVLRGRSLDFILDPEAANKSSQPSGHQEILESVLQLAEACAYERDHTHQVTRLALSLFDEWKPLHDFGLQDRLCLQCAALLHDIGRINGKSAHHKTAMHLILESPLLMLDEPDRMIVALIARYHRGPHPKATHKYFDRLPLEERKRVRMLSSILRVADALDRSHRSNVREVASRVSEKEIRLDCRVNQPIEDDRQAAQRKGSLLEEEFGRKLVIECAPL